MGVYKASLTIVLSIPFCRGRYQNNPKKASLQTHPLFCNVWIAILSIVSSSKKLNIKLSSIFHQILQNNSIYNVFEWWKRNFHLPPSSTYLKVSRPSTSKKGAAKPLKRIKQALRKVPLNPKILSRILDFTGTKVRL